MKVGLLFGSFDPVHNGHLDVAKRAAKSLDEVWFVVQPANKFKNRSVTASLADRLELIAESGFHAIAGHDTMLDSIKQIQTDHPHRQFVILLGDDLMQSLPSWQDYDQLKQFEIMPFERSLPISSQQVKDALVAHQPIDDLVPGHIHKRIVTLYRSE